MKPVKTVAQLILASLILVQTPAWADKKAESLLEENAKLKAEQQRLEEESRMLEQAVQETEKAEKSSQKNQKANKTETAKPAVETNQEEAASVDSMSLEEKTQIVKAEFGEDAQVGPAEITLGSEAILKLPENMIFVPKDTANRLMVEHGNSSSPDRYGLIMPLSGSEEESWLVDLQFMPEGYIKDDDAKDWDAEKMLTALKKGNEEQNKIRREKGFPEIETHGWIEKPQYDASNHRLIWSIDAYQKGAQDDDPSINYNMFQLGRKGYIELTMVSSLKQVDHIKPLAKSILEQIEFNPGERYEDFNEATDKIAEYGLTALVGGVAAKKLGLFAMLAALFAKFGKFAIIGLIALGAVAKKLFNRKNSDE